MLGGPRPKGTDMTPAFETGSSLGTSDKCGMSVLFLNNLFTGLYYIESRNLPSSTVR